MKILAIVAGRIADILMAVEDAPMVVDDTKFQFMRHLKRSLHDARQFGLDATLLAITASNPTTAHAYISSIQSEMRGLDVGFACASRRQQITLLILMPITGDSGLHDYLVRFEQFMVQHHGVGVDEAQIDIAHLPITSATRDGELHFFLGAQALLDQEAINDFEFLQQGSA